MAEYYQFAHSVQGYNHIKANKVCQDASGECHFEDVSIIAVADGHGSDNYIRTDRGSKFAVSAALTAIKAFVQEARENHLSTVPDSETELIQVSKNILARWYTQVENDVACEPFQPEELAKVSEKYKQRYASGQYNAKAYGTTLIAVCMTSEGWFGIHIGDGKCVELLENGTLCEPIPWDEACEQNITTSICDSDAIEEFRYVIQKDFPAAIPLRWNCMNCIETFSLSLQNIVQKLVTMKSVTTCQKSPDGAAVMMFPLQALFARIFLKVQLLKLGCAAKKSG